MNGTLDPKIKQHWPEEIASLTHAYNCTRNNATSYGPYFLMFRHKPPLPTNVEFWVNMPNIAEVSSVKYVAKVQKQMKWAFQQVNTFNEKEINHAKKHYDQNVRCSVLSTSDLVLVHVKAFKGKHKVSEQWKNVPYEVVRCIRDNFPVYKVIQKDSDLQSQVPHQNMLIPVIQCHESESSKVVLLDSCLVGSSNSDNNSLPSLTGPVTHTQTKSQGLLKANLLMNVCFESSVDFTLMEPCSSTLKTLIADYIRLQKEFLGWVHHI